MTEYEATARANAVMSVRAGTHLTPTNPAEFKNTGGRRTWTIYYEGFIVTVNDNDGQVFGVHENKPK
jgi:hypothetical protein